jgi:hypothetical protein
VDGPEDRPEDEPEDKLEDKLEDANPDEGEAPDVILEDVNKSLEPGEREKERSIGVWQGVAMDSLKFHLGLPSPTLLHPAGRLPLKWP